MADGGIVESEEVNSIGTTSSGKILLELSQMEYDEFLLSKKRALNIHDECWRIQPSKVPETVRQIRNHHGISQPDVAKAAGLSSVASISHYETGARKIDMAKLEKLANALGYDVNVVFTRQTDESVCGCGYPIIRVDGAWEHVGVPNGVDTRHIPMPKRQS